MTTRDDRERDEREAVSGSDPVPEGDWVAFLYASGDPALGESERAAFEARLGEDQEARESLSRGVELWLAMGGRLEAREDSRGGSVRRIAGGWAAAAAAAVALLATGVWGWGWVRWGENPEAGVSARTDGETDLGLALAWADFRASGEGSSADWNGEAGSEGAAEDEDSEAVPELELEGEAPEPPSWMMDGARALSRQDEFDFEAERRDVPESGARS